MANVTATLVVEGGSGPHLVWNQDLANTLYIGDSNSIKANDTTVIAVGPNTSVSVDGRNDVFATVTSSTPISVAVLQGGMSSFLGITEAGGAFIGTSFRFYSGPPALDDLVASISAMQSTDPVGNPVLKGFTVYDTASEAYIEVLPASPPTIDIATGQSFEALPGFLRSQVITAGDGSKALGIFMNSPLVSGSSNNASVFVNSDTNTESFPCGVFCQAGGATGLRFIVHPSQVIFEDFSNAPWLMIKPPAGTGPFQNNVISAASNGQLELDSSLISNIDVAAVLQLQSQVFTGTAPKILLPGTTTLVSVGGTATDLTKINTDVWQNLAGFVNGWTAGGNPPRCGIMPWGIGNNNGVWMEGDFTPGTLTDSTQMCTVPVGYRPSTTRNLWAGTRGGTASTNSPIVQVLASGVVQCESMPTGTTTVRVNGWYPLN